MGIIILVFLCCFLILQVYYWFFFANYAFRNDQKVAESQYEPISIVVCGKNAAHHFESLIPKLFEQEYPNFEVVVVDDHSTDDTAKVFYNLQTQYENLSIVSKSQVPDRAGKKAALFEGVKQAKNEWIIVTDTDCEPVSNNWLLHFSQKMKDPYNLILGISPNTKQSGFWKGLMRMETIYTLLFYISFASRNIPYMGVGRNMAFRKSTFLEKFTHVLKSDMASGDDDLYVNFAAEGKTTALCIHPESFTISDCPNSLQSWFNQKRRHLSAGFSYKKVHIILLSIFPISQWLFLFSFIILLFTPVRWLILVLAIFQFLTQQIIHAKVLSKTNHLDIALEYPIYQLLWMFFQPYITLTSRFQSKKKWK